MYNNRLAIYSDLNNILSNKSLIKKKTFLLLKKKEFLLIGDSDQSMYQTL